MCLSREIVQQMHSVWCWVEYPQILLTCQQLSRNYWAYHQKLLFSLPRPPTEVFWGTSQCQQMAHRDSHSYGMKPKFGVWSWKPPGASWKFKICQNMQLGGPWRWHIGIVQARAENWYDFWLRGEGLAEHIGLNNINQKSIFIKLEGILASSVVLWNMAKSSWLPNFFDLKWPLG